MIILLRRLNESPLDGHRGIFGQRPPLNKTPSNNVIFRIFVVSYGLYVLRIVETNFFYHDTFQRIKIVRIDLWFSKPEYHVTHLYCREHWYSQ